MKKSKIYMYEGKLSLFISEVSVLYNYNLKTASITKIKNSFINEIMQNRCKNIAKLESYEITLIKFSNFGINSRCCSKIVTDSFLSEILNSQILHGRTNFIK